MNNSKIAAVATGLAIVGLSLGDALTGHGIKGNNNLNPLIVGTGSSSSSSSSSSSTSSSSSSSSNSSFTGYKEVNQKDTGETESKCVNGVLWEGVVLDIDCKGYGQGRLDCPGIGKQVLTWKSVGPCGIA